MCIRDSHKAERGEKIEYATMRNRRQTSDMQEQLPKHLDVYKRQVYGRS